MTAKERLLEYLSDGEWHLSRDIQQVTGLSRDDMRSLDVLADGTVIGNTRRGFKLTRLASRQELNMALADLGSRMASLRDRQEALRSYL